MTVILMFHKCDGQSHKTVSTVHNFWRERRAEADSNQGPSAYQPNALPQAKPAHKTWEGGRRLKDMAGGRVSIKQANN